MKPIIKLRVVRIVLILTICNCNACAVVITIVSRTTSLTQGTTARIRRAVSESDFSTLPVPTAALTVATACENETRSSCSERTLMDHLQRTQQLPPQVYIKIIKAIEFRKRSTRVITSSHRNPRHLRRSVTRTIVAIKAITHCPPSRIRNRYRTASWSDRQ